MNFRSWPRLRSFIAIPCCVQLLFFVPSTVCHAQSKVAIARELAELVTKRFGKEAAEEGTEILARKLETVIAKYGDDGIEAVQKLGPRAIRLMEDAGADGLISARLLSRFGDDAVWIVGNSGRRQLVNTLGDDAAKVMIKHGEIAEPLLTQAGAGAVKALNAVSAQNGRRLAMLSEQGDLAKIGNTSALLDVVAKFGDKSMEFIWKNKGTLAVGAGLTAFLANPQPFIEGTKDIASVVTTNAIAPMAEQVGQKTNWTLAIVALIGTSGAYLAFRRWLSRPLHRR